MAKKLIYSYTFDASAQTVKIKGYYLLRNLILITNTTDGVIIYNFADPAAGATTSYDAVIDETTITLAYNTTSMSDSDELQILLDDAQDTKIDAGESLIDPVHKFRVSNPENLIDTDFEYGLQASKWETLELVNNIPSVYARDSNTSIGGLTAINTLQNSDSVTIVTSVPHDLSVGDPIEVNGTGSRTADGKYLITAVPSTTSLKYRSSEVQSATQDILTAYTTVIPGSFFFGSDIQFDQVQGIETDGLNPSTLSVKTPNVHGISTTASIYVTNSVGKQEFTVNNTSSTAADGSTVINTTDSTIYLPSHNLYTGQQIYVQAGSGGVLPTVSTSGIEPNGEDTIRTAYNAAKTSLDDIYSTLQSTNKHSAVLLYNSSAQSSLYPRMVNGSQRSFNVPDSGGRSARQYFLYYGHYSNTNEYIRVLSGNRNFAQRIDFSNFRGQQPGTTTLYTGNPVDYGQYFTYTGASGNNWVSFGAGAAYNHPNSLSGHLWFQGTPFVHNTTVPYILNVFQYSLWPGANAASQADGNGNALIYTEEHDYRTKGSSLTAYRNNDEIYNGRYNNPFSLGNGWKYNYGLVRYRPQYYTNDGVNNIYYPGYVNIELDIWNDQWSDHPTGTFSNDYYMRTWYQAYSLSCRNDSYHGKHWRVEALIPFGVEGQALVFNSTTQFNTIYTYDQLASQLATDVTNALQYADWDNTAGINTVQAVAQTGDRISLRADTALQSPFVFTNSGTGPVEIETNQVTGVLDNYYTVTGVGSTGFNITGQNQFAPRTLEFADTDVITDNSNYYVKITGGHGIQQGQIVTFNVVSGATFPGLTSGTQYNVFVADSEHLLLCANEQDAAGGTQASTGAPASTGSYNIQVYSINGTVAGIGQVSIADGSSVVTGTGTKFTTTFNVGDPFVIETEGSTINSLLSVPISSVVSDTSLTLDTAPGFAVTDVNYYVSTKIHVRADGEFLHRPFDGGVDITAGKSPDSSIVRQTRKYFRYQSGKGIQCSMAINFNPARPVRTASGSGSNITMTTEYPHGLVAGNTVLIQGAEEPISLSPQTSGTSYDSASGILTIAFGSAHNINVNDEISLVEESFTFTCAKDSHATNHTYPRSTDPAGGLARLRVISVPSSTTLTVDVGTSTYVGAHTIVSVDADAVTHHDQSNAYNGTYDITAATDFTFSYTSGSTVNVANPDGFIEYAISGYKNAGIRAGLFDTQNGFFYEYDGKYLYCVRRSSVQQISGTVNVVNSSNIILGENTVFTKQLKASDMVVIRGQSYKVISIESDTEIHVQPGYRGTSNSNVVVTKTVDTRVKQPNWSIDKADGTGPSGYNLDINKIQMVYMDYSWYGAGKIRFGFKDTYGHVKYMHEFIHNNRLNEAYMRTGNVPARYEVFNKGIPTFVPSLFHWGTSVIMDGGFDDDDSYLFTATGNALTFTNGDADTATTTADSTLVSTGRRFKQYYVRLQFATSDASKFTTGIPLYTSDGELSGEPVDSTEYGSGGAFYVYVFISSGYSAPATFPSVASGATVNIGAEVVGTTDIDLDSNIPLISIRLAPSVDNNLIGQLGERDIVNRMQLKLQELGVSVSHDVNVKLILNGSLSNLSYQNIGTPSLTQYIAHASGDTIDGGTEIYSFRASGGTEDANGKRFVASNNFDISSLVDLGNSILGGDLVYPDGPDIVTVAVSVVNTSEIDSTSSFQVQSRISWAESQA
jgi:hypothetical protein